MGNTPMERLVDLARWIFAWQGQQELTDAQIARKYPGLGSAKTYRDLRAGRVAGYDVERWITEYGIVRSEIELREHDAKEEDVYTDLSTVVQIRRAALNAMATNGSNRVVIVTGGSGSGKTFALRGLTSMYGSRILALDALDTWNDKPVNLLGAMMRAMGMENPPIGANQRLAKVQEYLCRSRTMVAVDEGQHLGPHCINTVKALVNCTPSEFLILAMGTLWSRLETQAYQEAAQISKNRLCERVDLDLEVQDIMRFLKHRFSGLAKKDLSVMGQMIQPAAYNNGNISFVRDVCNAAADMLGDEPLLSRDVLSNAIGATSAKRTTCKKKAV